MGVAGAIVVRSRAEEAARRFAGGVDSYPKNWGDVGENRNSGRR